MDDGIGQIIRALERTSQRENTLVVFISDNGGQKSWHSDTEYKGAYADKPHDVLGDNSPLRGWKVDLYEGWIRVPAFVSWPGRLNFGMVNEPIHIADWLPTLLHQADGSHELESLQLDGQDIWPLLISRNSEYIPHPLYWKTKSAFAVRDGDWKLIVNSGTHQNEIYDLADDFRETTNLSDTHPEKVKKNDSSVGGI